MVRKETEVAIVGAGATGAYLARRFAEAGKAVTVLEAGPAWEMEDLVSSQIWSRRLRWGGPPVIAAGDRPYGYGFNGGWGLGGAALHHYGTWPRLRESDFKVRSTYGRGLDWPIDYGDLRPFYDRIQAEVGVSGDATIETLRPPGDPYPLRPVPPLTQATVLKRGFDALGIPTFPAPMAILTEPYKGRAPCIYDGWCDAGCPINALWNPLVEDIPRAKAAGAEFRTRAYVSKLVAERGRITSLRYGDSEGRIRTLRADTVILAASVVHNPVILLNSADADHPNGLANRSGLLGAYFMAHALTPTFGMFPDRTDNFFGVSGAHLMSHAGYPKDRGDGPFGSHQWLIAPAIKPNDLAGVATSRADLFGPALHAFMDRAVHHLANMLNMAEELPRRESRIELSDVEGPDGARTAKITHRFDENTLALRELARQEGERVMRAAGAEEVWFGPVGHAHMMGGTIMGDDPAASVCDSFGRTHDHENLIIAGPGLFPTAGAANPTFTAYALAARTAGEVLKAI